MLPFVTTNFSNLNLHNVILESKKLINNIQDTKLMTAFTDTKIICTQRQPRNLLNLLSKAQLKNDDNCTKPIITNCKDSRCNICKWYLQKDTSFAMTNRKVWNVKHSMSCHSTNVIYYLVCKSM